MQNTRIMRQRHLIPVLSRLRLRLPLPTNPHHCPNDLRNTPPPRPYRLRKRLPILQIRPFHPRLERQQIQHRHRPAPLPRAELADLVPLAPPTALAPAPTPPHAASTARRTAAVQRPAPDTAVSYSWLRRRQAGAMTRRRWRSSGGR
jgi:hypothetical protein